MKRTLILLLFSYAAWGQTAEDYYNKGLKKAIKYPKEAIEYFNKAIELNPSYAEAYFWRGSAKYALNDISGQTEDLNKAIEINPKYADAYYFKGLIKIELRNDTIAACPDFQKAAELGHKDAKKELRRCKCK